MIYIQFDEQVSTAQSDPSLDPSLLQVAAAETLLQAGADPSAELSVVVSDDARLHELNRQFLGIDAPTDVLSFPAGEIDPDTDAPYLGDVILSLPRARLQAVAGGHPLEDELRLLVVHGVLHLLGHDHIGEAEKEVMWAAQASVLRALNASITGPQAE